MNPVQEIEFLGTTISSLKICLSLPQEKVLKIQSQCQDVLAKDQVTVSQTNKIVRPSCLNISGSFASSDEYSISSATANKSIESYSLLSNNCIRQQEFKGGTSVVDPKSPDFQWALPNSASTFFDNKDGCIQKRLGSSLSGNSNRRGMKFTGTTTSYKCIRNEGSKTSFASISQAFSDEKLFISK